jgi:hypothetical protein
MYCPYCKHFNEKESEVTSEHIIFNCSNCGNIYRFNHSLATSDDICSVGVPFHNFLEVILPNFKIGDSVMCVDTKHPLFLKDGFVKELDHLHARILFKGNKLIWMNQNVIAKIPS